MRNANDAEVKRILGEANDPVGAAVAHLIEAVQRHVGTGMKSDVDLLIGAARNLIMTVEDEAESRQGSAMFIDEADDISEDVLQKAVDQITSAEGGEGEGNDQQSILINLWNGVQQLKRIAGALEWSNEECRLRKLCGMKVGMEAVDAHNNYSQFIEREWSGSCEES